MSSGREDLFQQWARPPSETERLKAERAESAVREAVNSSPVLDLHSISVFTQGSYRNRTNVRQDSDVDVCVLCDETFFFHLPDGKRANEFGITVPASYPYQRFKEDVAKALFDHFGSSRVTRGSKAFDIHENTYRIDADVIPCFEYRFYQNGGDYVVGTGFVPDGATQFIYNYPQQNYDNGVSKNGLTYRRFKAVVRILKRLCYAMRDAGVPEARHIPSYLIECLAWNVPNNHFTRDSLTESVSAVIADIWSRTGVQFVYKEWFEVNGFKFLFHGSQPWTREQANAFALAAWNHVGFE
jgi:hypothetical protein